MLIQHERRLPVVSLLLCILAGCAALPGSDFDRPEVELLGLRPLSGRGMEARFQIRLRIVNPNTTAISINGMSYDIYLRDKRVLSGVSDQAIDIGPFSEAVAELEVAAGMLGSLSLLHDLVTHPPNESIPYSLRAKLALDGALGRSLRVTREGQINLSGR